MRVSMQKIQVLFPDPVMRRLRAVAEQEDRPVSELIRRAVERLLDQSSAKPQQPKAFPTFHGGEVMVKAGDLKSAIYGDE
jgi:hypothetical protein